MRRLALAIWLVVVWVALWGDLSTANVVSGLLVAVLLLAVFPSGGQMLPRYRVRPVAVVRLGLYFVGQVLAANWTLIRTVVSRDDRLRTGVIAVPLVCESDGLLAIVSNLTALTPGTMVIEIDREPPRFYVHVVRIDDVEAARAQMRTLERHVIEAFGPPEAVAVARAERRRGARTRDEVQR
jgi:multicomponent Na+:H+ antiporter subunit E